MQQQAPAMQQSTEVKVPDSSAPVVSVQPVDPHPRFTQLVKQHELKPETAKQLYTVLTSCEIVLLCDDSGSMQSTIVEPISQKSTTRWMELKRLAAVVIEYVTAVVPEGLDLYFLNRGIVKGVKSVSGLQDVFSEPPTGGTPLNGCLQKIYADKAYVSGDRQLLIVVVTDGVPSDGTKEQLHQTIRAKSGNTHISFAECTDRPEDMEWLDEIDKSIPKFDNTDDYREELDKVRRLKGATFKFDFNDYVIKILLATFVKSYFNIDQANSGCCVML